MSREQINPSIYCDDKSLIEALLERFPYYDIFWYHWPQDGFFDEEDFEPVIVTYNEDGTLCSVIVRKAWRFNSRLREEVILPLRIQFSVDFHHPTIVTSSQTYDGLNQILPIPYQPISVKASNIENKFRTGHKHKSNFLRIPRTDPSEEAQRHVREYCISRT